MPATDFVTTSCRSGARPPRPRQVIGALPIEYRVDATKKRPNQVKQSLRLAGRVDVAVSHQRALRRGLRRIQHRGERAELPVLQSLCGLVAPEFALTTLRP